MPDGTGHEPDGPAGMDEAPAEDASVRDRRAENARGAPRRELPRDAEGLPPMGDVFSDALEAGLRELGLSAEPAGRPEALHSYELHARLLREWGAAINLTAVREPAEVARRHVCDSLSAVPRLTRLLRPGATLLDVGSGAGYPGLPLAAALPLGRVALLDSVGKKARFLAVAGVAVRGALVTNAAVGPRSEVAAGGGAAAVPVIPVIEAVAERAEDLAEEPDHRGAWDIVTARAVGSLAEVLELAMPLTREGGCVVAWKREEEQGGLRAELRDAGSIIRATGGGRPEVIVVPATSLAGHRLVIVPKERPTPASYPRPAGVRRRRERRAHGPGSA